MTYLPTAADVSPAPPLGTGVPPPTGAITVPQSPSGSVTGESADWNFANTETSTERTLVYNSNAAATSFPTPALASPVTIAGCTSVAQNAWQESCVEKVQS